MHSNNQHFLAVIALGPNQSEILEAFTKVSKSSGCNILECKLTTLGEECALLFHLGGSWNTVAKLEATLPMLGQQFDFFIQTKRTLPASTPAALPYHVQVIGHDRAGILNELSLFFMQQGVSILQMDGETYFTKNNTVMANLTFMINIPVKLHLATFRDRFLSYCEDRNLDPMIEPFKSN